MSLSGHFTQTVWKNSTYIGVGAAKGPKGIFAVANFSPIGNITNPGYFEENVLPPESGWKSEQSFLNEKKSKEISSNASIEEQSCNDVKTIIT